MCYSMDTPTHQKSFDVNEKRVFSDKVATLSHLQFDGVKNGSVWRSSISNYLISKAPELQNILPLVEACEDRAASIGYLASLTSSWMPYARLQMLGMELWGFLNLNITGNARARFENVS